MNQPQKLTRATQAKAILENPMYVEAFNLCRLAILDRIEKCPLTDTAHAEAYRHCLKLLRDVQANLTTTLNTGKIEEFNIAEAEKAKKNPFRGLFR